MSSKNLVSSKYLLRVDEILPDKRLAQQPQQQPEQRLPSAQQQQEQQKQQEQQEQQQQPPKPPQPLKPPPLSSVSTASTAPSDEADGRSDCSEQHERNRIIQRLYQEAYCPEDVKMLEVFGEIIGLEQMIPEFVKPVLRSMKLLRLCDYTAEDICCIMAHAGTYFRQVFGICGNEMDASEVGNVAATLLFIAHSFTQDEVCPLRVWHRHLFKKYCSMKLLNAAVFRLLRICHFRLRIENQDIEKRFRLLMRANGTPLPEDWRLPERGGPLDASEITKRTPAPAVAPAAAAAERSRQVAPPRKWSFFSTAL